MSSLCIHNFKPVAFTKSHGTFIWQHWSLLDWSWFVSFFPKIKWTNFKNKILFKNTTVQAQKLGFSKIKHRTTCGNLNLSSRVLYTSTVEKTYKSAIYSAFVLTSTFLIIWLFLLIKNLIFNVSSLHMYTYLFIHMF